MKELNKLQISSERLIKKEELLKIKGGQYQNACTCYCFTVLKTYGYYLSPEGDCVGGCSEAFGNHVWGVCNN